MTARHWSEMFAAVQHIAHLPLTFDKQIKQICAFAMQNPTLYTPSEYWQTVVSNALPYEAIMAWSKAALVELPSCNHWSLLMLDCGDGGDVFRLTDFQINPAIRYEDFESVARAKTLRHGEDFPIPMAQGRVPKNIADHSIGELQHPVLSYDSLDINSSLLWLSMATFALCETLRDATFCKQILQGRKKMMVMSGFEAIFFYVGVVSNEGLGF
ncbi:MAG: hypothetical protein JNJ78_09155 [Anaerolineae bacterium]|nr:hypothetical protein [Anaerolineae bacterium]